MLGGSPERATMLPELTIFGSSVSGSERHLQSAHGGANLGGC